MRKNNFFTAVTVFLVVMISFGAFEITARFFEEMDRSVVTKEFDPTLGWRLKPGRHFVRPSGKIKTVILEINSKGLRGPEIPEDGSGEERILMLGDSFVFSRHFELGDTFTGRLEKLLNAAGGKKKRVLNAGVPGYGTGQELLFMKKLAEEYKIVADTYILMVFPNDILDNLRLSYGNYEAVPVKPGFELNAAGQAVLKEMPVNDLEGLKESFRRPDKQSFWKLRSVQFARESIAAFFQSHPGLIKRLIHLGVDIQLPRKPGLLNGWYDDRIVNDGVPLMKALMSEMKAEADKHGASFKVVIAPSPIQIYPNIYRKILLKQFPEDIEVKGWVKDPLKAQKMIGDMCAQLGIDYLDLYDVFKKQSNRQLYLPGDGHFDIAAHEITANTLAEWMNASATEDVK